MQFKIEYIKDVVGNNYLGINVPFGFISNYLTELSEVLESEYDSYISNQQKRDRGYHITVLNVAECNHLSTTMGMDKFSEKVEHLSNIDINIKPMGIGSANRGDNTTYFIVLESSTLDEIRRSLGLKHHDHHITIGFKWKDVFGVDKGVPSLINKKSQFIGLLSHLYKSDDQWSFLLDISNWEYPKQNMKVISISETTLTICLEDGTRLQIGLIGDELRVATESKSQYDRVNGLSTNEIRKILN